MKRLTRLTALSCLLALCSAPLMANPVEDTAGHLAAIAQGNVPTLMHHYADDAQLLWVGGPLDGHYSGRAAIQSLWEHFASAQGKLALTSDTPAESANPRGSTVFAKALYVGKNRIKVLHVLVFRNDQIVSEIWQVDPSLNVSQAALTGH